MNDMHVKDGPRTCRPDASAGQLASELLSAHRSRSFMSALTSSNADSLLSDTSRACKLVNEDSP